MPEIDPVVRLQPRLQPHAEPARQPHRLRGLAAREPQQAGEVEPEQLLRIAGLGLGQPADQPRARRVEPCHAAIGRDAGQRFERRAEQRGAGLEAQHQQSRDCACSRRFSIVVA